ncbi:MAG: hypothetical protein ABIP48_13485 [Planctomycetota bacterium]
MSSRATCGSVRAKNGCLLQERLLLRWNADPYQLDEGNGGRTRNDGTFILLPYWMGRYYRLLD